ncbi:ribonuclease,putative, putative [Plasmodium sp. DRC-Itaito]|nr:ribonuclease,putative, putative [Plasmodium sp. DRC-Itaito]
MKKEEWNKYNLYEVGVHITDVSFFIKENSSLDIDARNRAMTIYLTHTCFPMISKILSEELCSLDPVNNRLCLSIFFYMDSSGKIDHNSFFIKESIINSKVKFSYEEVYFIIRQYVKIKQLINKLKKEKLNDILNNHTHGKLMQNYNDNIKYNYTLNEDNNINQLIKETKHNEIINHDKEIEQTQDITKKKTSIYRRFLNLHFYKNGNKQKKNSQSGDSNGQNDILHEQKNILYEKNHNLHEQKNILYEKNDNLHEQKNILYEQNDNLHEQKNILYDKNHNLHEQNDNLHEQNNNLHDHSITLHEQNDIISDHIHNSSNRTFPNENNIYTKYQTHGKDIKKNLSDGNMFDIFALCQKTDKSDTSCNNKVVCLNKKEKKKIIISYLLKIPEVKEGIDGLLKIFENLNNMKHKLTYKEMISIIKHLYDMHKITKGARNIRRENGSMFFNNDKINFILSNSRSPIGIVRKKYTFSNYMIEELMLSANKLIAIRQYFSKYRDISVFRSHNLNDAIDINDIMDLLKKSGIHFEFHDLRQIMKFLDEKKKYFKQKKNNIYDIVSAYMKKKMVRAEYHTYKYIKDNNMSTYHYALSFLLYTHFTSPIRRYPDILVHRVIKKIISDEQKLNQNLFTEQEILKNTETHDVGILEKICENCNNCKAKSKKAQVDCEIAFFCLYLQKLSRPGYNRGIIMDIYKEKSSIYFKSFSFENNLYHSGFEKHFHKMNKDHLKYLFNYVIQPNVAKQEITVIINTNKKKGKIRRVYKRFDYIPLYFIPLNSMPPSYFLAVALIK